jgi:thymidylate kinase
VLIGPDGSGKSSLSEVVGSRLAHRPFKVVHRFKSTFNILPPLKAYRSVLCRLLGRPKHPQTLAVPGQLHSGMSGPNPIWVSMIYAAYYALDLWLGRLWLRCLRGRCALIVFDRYYYDYFYQIGNRGLPRWYLKLFGCLVPKPDLVVEIDRDADEIYRQKPELTVKEIRIEQDIIHQLLAGCPETRVVDARHGLDATGKAVESLILQWVMTRQPRPLLHP